MYLIITTKKVEHEDPYHRNNSWTEEVQVVNEYESYSVFYDIIKLYTLNAKPFKAYEAKQFTVTTNIEVVVK